MAKLARVCDQNTCVVSQAKVVGPSVVFSIEALSENGLVAADFDNLLLEPCKGVLAFPVYYRHVNVKHS